LPPGATTGHGFLIVGQRPMAIAVLVLAAGPLPLRDLELKGQATGWNGRREAVTSLILVIGALNVCLGYALAVYLGYGPSGPQETWEPLSDELPLGEQAGDLIDDPTLGLAGRNQQSL
jgi:hypothetical protein